MGFSNEWEKIYQTGAHNSVWPWSDVVSLTNRYFRGGDKSSLRVLELGCGAGANIPFFSAIGMKYCGIEGSMTMVQELKKRYLIPHNTDECFPSLVDVRRGDFTEAIPFDGEFDLVVDRGSVTCNSTADIRKAIALAYEKLRKGGYYFGLSWISTKYGVFSDATEQCSIIDDHTRVFHSGYFEGLGNVHFSDADHIRELFHQMTIIELYEKTSVYTVPAGKTVASWNFVAQK